MKTIKSFIKQSHHLNTQVIRAVVRQIGGWESFKESARDIANHGAGGGFAGFTYYSDTVAFTKRHKTAILDVIEQLASDLGESVYALIANFNCLKLSESAVAEAIHNWRSDERTNVFNALAWFALEEVARSYSDLCDN